MTTTPHGQVPEALRLADRVRPGSEAAPWVVEAIRQLECELETLRTGYDAARLEIDHLRGATKMIEQPADEYPPLPEVPTPPSSAVKG